MSSPLVKLHRLITSCFRQAWHSCINWSVSYTGGTKPMGANRTSNLPLHPSSWITVTYWSSHYHRTASPLRVSSIRFEWNSDTNFVGHQRPLFYPAHLRQTDSAYQLSTSLDYTSARCRSSALQCHSCVIDSPCVKTSAVIYSVAGHAEDSFVLREQHLLWSWVKFLSLSSTDISYSYCSTLNY